MTRILNITLITACFLLLLSSNCFAADISLEWDASSAEDIAGYKVYYRADSAILPFDGFEANEGNSPIDVGNNINISLSGLSGGSLYYLRLSLTTRPVSKVPSPMLLQTNGSLS